MLSNTDLLASLNVLQGLYSAAAGGPPAEQKRICKYGLLELCGWIEEAQDFIVNRCAAKITDSDLISIVKERVKRTHGFAPEAHFIPLLGLVIGLRNYEAIRAKLILAEPMFDPAVLAMSNLMAPRNTHAHTHFAVANLKAIGYLAGREPKLLTLEAQKIHTV